MLTVTKKPAIALLCECALPNHWATVGKQSHTSSAWTQYSVLRRQPLSRISGTLDMTQPQFTELLN